MPGAGVGDTRSGERPNTRSVSGEPHFKDQDSYNPSNPNSEHPCDCEAHLPKKALRQVCLRFAVPGLTQKAT